MDQSKSQLALHNTFRLEIAHRSYRGQLDQLHENGFLSGQTVYIPRTPIGEELAGAAIMLGWNINVILFDEDNCILPGELAVETADVNYTWSKSGDFLMTQFIKTELKWTNIIPL